MSRGGSQYQFHGQVKTAEKVLTEAFARALTSREKDAQLTRDMLADVLLNQVMLPHCEVQVCSQWLQQHVDNLSPAMSTVRCGRNFKI